MKEIEIKYKYKQNFLYVIVEGKDNLQNSITYWIDLIEEARLRKYKNVLIVERLVGILAKSDIFRLIKEILKIESNHIRKIAFVDYEQEHLESNEFGATLMLQKGLNIMIFKTQAEAIDWLNK